MKVVRQFMGSMSRGQKRLLQLLADTILIWIALWLSFAIRLGELDAAKPKSVSCRRHRKCSKGKRGLWGPDPICLNRGN